MNRIITVFGFVYITAPFVTVGCTDAVENTLEDTAILLDAGASDDASLLDVGREIVVDTDSSDSASLSDVGLDTVVDASATICSFDTVYSQYIAEITCGIPLTQPAESSDIYQLIQMRDGGFVSDYELCETNSYGWYPNKPTNPTAMVACANACLRMISLFPSYIVSTQDLFGCDTATDADASPSDAGFDAGPSEYSSRDFFCSSPKDQFENIKDISCEVPITQPIDSDPIYYPRFNDPSFYPLANSIDVKAPEVVSRRDQCDVDPYAWYLDDPTAPTKVFACESLCDEWRGSYPFFIASMRAYFHCSGEGDGGSE